MKRGVDDLDNKKNVPNRSSQAPTEKALKVSAVLSGRDSWEGILSDVSGSYTGTPVDDWEPIQDADDL